MDYLCTIVTTFLCGTDKTRQTEQHVLCPSRFEARRMADTLNDSLCDVEATVSVRIYKRTGGTVILSASAIEDLLEDWTRDTGQRSTGKPSYVKAKVNGHDDDMTA